MCWWRWWNPRREHVLGVRVGGEPTRGGRAGGRVEALCRRLALVLRRAACALRLFYVLSEHHLPAIFSIGYSDLFCVVFSTLSFAAPFVPPAEACTASCRTPGWCNGFKIPKWSGSCLASHTCRSTRPPPTRCSPPPRGLLQFSSKSFL